MQLTGRPLTHATFFARKFLFFSDRLQCQGPTASYILLAHDDLLNQHVYGNIICKHTIRDAGDIKGKGESLVIGDLCCNPVTLGLLKLQKHCTERI